MSTKFTLGNRVKVTGDYAFSDEKGTVVFVSPGGTGIMVCMDDGLRLESFEAHELETFVQPEVKMINTRMQLLNLADTLGTRGDWHGPDNQSVTAKVYGQSFDNAGFWGEDSDDKEYQEMYVVLSQDGEPVARVNLATLFAWATGYDA